MTHDPSKGEGRYIFRNVWKQFSIIYKLVWLSDCLFFPVSVTHKPIDPFDMLTKNSLKMTFNCLMYICHLFVLPRPDALCIRDGSACPCFGI